LFLEQKHSLAFFLIVFGTKTIESKILRSLF